MKLSRAYLAGLIDGEGSISIYRRNPGINGYTSIQPFLFTPVFKIGMTGEIAKQIIVSIQEKYGGDFWIRDYENGYKPCAVLTIKGRKIMLFLKEIYPFLIVKKEQARIIFEFFSGEMTQKEWKSQEMPKSEYERRKALYEKIRTLNLKGTKESVAETK